MYCSTAFGQGASAGGTASGGGTASALGGSNVTISSLAVVPSGSPTQNVGQTLGLTATITWSDATTTNVTASVAWSSSNLGIGSFVSLTATENIICNSAGTVSFTATYGNVSGSIPITCLGVLPPKPTPVSLAIAPASPSIPVGQTGGVQFTATETYSDNSTQNVTASAVFSSATPSVATVGVLTATREIDCNGNSGTSSITATNDGLSSPGVTLTCVAVPTLNSVVVTPGSPSIIAGTTQSFIATCNYSDGSSQTCSNPAWSSSNTAAATITSAGLATSLAAGTTTIKAQLGSTSGTTTLTVTTPGPPPPTQTSTSVAPANSTINKTTTLQYAATAVFSDGSTQPCPPATTWNSTSTGVATISSSGLATGVANGSTTIQATCNTILGSTTLTVQTPAPTLSSIAVTPAIPTQYNGSAVQFTATGTYSDGSTQNLTSQVTWTTGTPAVATISANTATCVANSGSSTITATLGAVSGNTSLTCQTATTNTGGNAYCTPSNTWIGPTTDGPANLPTACMYTPVSATPSPGTVRGPDSLTSTVQADINAAACGDTILVTAGSILGSITLPGKGCDSAHWITIKSTGVANVNFPAEGTRFTPCWSGVASLPGRPAYTCPSPQVLTFKIVTPNASNGISSTHADHYRIIGAEITRVSTGGVAIYNLVDLSSSGTQTNNIIFDRVWCHGIETTFPATSQAADTSTTRCWYLGQSNHVAVIDSYISDFYDTGSMAANGNSDSQCVGGGFGNIANSGWGVYKFVNNHCEASGEGILLGGANGPALTPPGCTIMVNCNLDVPTDLEVRGNYFFKPQLWNGNTTTINTVGWPVVKNGFEMKIGARALFEGNVIENTWLSAQVGYCWSTAPKNQSGGSPSVGTAPTALTNDFTYRYNYCYNTSYGIGLYQSMDGGCTGCQAQGANRVSIHDNVIGDDLNAGALTCSPNCSTGDEMELLVSPDSTNQGLNRIQNVNISHNTFPRGMRALVIFGGANAGVTSQMQNFTVQNNIWAYGNYGFGPISNGCEGNVGFSDSAKAILDGCAASYVWDHDAVFNWNGGPLGAKWPTNGSGLGNFFYTGTSGPGFTNYGTGDSGFNPGNYKLLTSSPLHNAGSDGKDLGADTVTLLSKIAGVRQ